MLAPKLLRRVLFLFAYCFGPNGVVSELMAFYIWFKPSEVIFWIFSFGPRHESYSPFLIRGFSAAVTVVLRGCNNFKVAL